MATDRDSRGRLRVRRPADGPVVGLTGARFGGAAGRRSRSVVQPPEELNAVASHHHPGDQPVVGQTGARFPPIVSRWRRKLHDPEQQDPEQQDPEQAAEATGGDDPPNQQVVPQPEIAPSVPASDGADWVDGDDWDATKETYHLVRPYFLTGGRTASRFELSFETLISATGQAADPADPPEHRTILTLCATPHSVAELAALLSVPLGVARVVLGDMAEAGSIVVHRTAGSADAVPDIDLMRRVLSGLQRL